MRTILRAEVAGAIEIGGRDCPEPEIGDTGVPNDFGIVAKALWPRKTAACLASIGGKDERTAKRWLKGEYEAPASVYFAINDRIRPKRIP